MIYFKKYYTQLNTVERLKNALTVFFIFFFLPIASFAQDTLLFDAVKSNDTKLLNEWIKKNDVNGYYGEKSYTPLVISIKKERTKLVKLLLRKGAAIEQLCQDKTPLIHSVESDNLGIVKILIKKGADINGTSLKENTAMVYAAFFGYADIARYLVKKGINYNLYNAAGKTALDYANTHHRYEVASFLHSIHAESEEILLPDYLDGPYVWWPDNQVGTIIYLKRDSSKNITTMETQNIDRKSGTIHFNGFAGDTNSYELFIKKPDRDNIFRNVDRVFAMGDIHGGYYELIELLKNNDIIDENLKWNWGKGHLVFLGDLFDRGDYVTECLWLIYRLEHEAIKAGGKVHMLLGNHELMIIDGITNDVSRKYEYLSQYLEFNLEQFYGNDFEIGKWLRSKKTIVKINNNLFVHGGISPEFLNTGINIRNLNNLVYRYLNNELDSTEITDVELILGDKGPFWYRGYFGNWNGYKQITEESVDKTLEFFNVSRIIVGHTNVNKIKGLYHGKIYATDIPYYLSDEVVLQGLLIEGETFYRVYPDGKRIKLE
ncbi:MAG: ankyrin repeat domain-containing protein [Bacteroidetes bacterium]|nr:ankyrin repeat domain-containing protein [Bacteroidota bacterium]